MRAPHITILVIGAILCLIGIGTMSIGYGMVQAAREISPVRILAPTVSTNPADPIMTVVVEAPQLLLGNTPESTDPDSRNILVVCHGQQGDHFQMGEHPEGPELWIIRNGEKFQMIPGMFDDPETKLPVPADVYVLVNEHNEIVEWMPTWMVYQPSVSTMPSDQASSV